MKKTKKAQGNILIIVLIALLAIIGLVILWNIIYPLIKEKSKEADASLLGIELNIKEVVLSETGALRMSIERRAGKGELTSLKFIFYDENGNSKIIIQDKDLPKELETKTYYFSPISDIGKIKEVSAVAFVNEKAGREFKSDLNAIKKIPEGLVSWWRFEDNQDLVGRNNGLLINNAQIDNGNLILNGNAYNYFDIGNDSSLSMDSQFVVSAWIRPQAYGGKIISKGLINKNYEVALNENGKIRFVYGIGNYNESSIILPLNEWSHVFVGVDWKGVWKIFVNGKLGFIGEGIISPNINDYNSKIGEGFNGEITDLMIFNKTLSVENIDFLYKNQLK